MNANVSKLLKEVAALLPPLLVTAGVFAGFVALVGGITTWSRFWASQLPPEQAVDVVPRTELVVIGAVTLLFFGVLGLLAVLACYLVDDAGRARKRTLVGLLLVGAAEASLIVIELRRDDDAGPIWEPAVLLVGAFVAACLVAWKGTRETHPLPRNGREQAAAERADERQAAGDAAAAEQARAAAQCPLRCELRLSGFIGLTLVAIGTALIAWKWLEVPDWAAVGFFLAFLFPLLTYHVAHVTGARFAWYGIALLFSVPLFGAVVNTLRLLADPQAKPVALIRKGDKKDEGVQGLYITETDKRVYLASVATEGCGGQTVRKHSGRIFWVPRDDIVAMAVGPLQDIAKAAVEAPEMVADRAATRVDLKTTTGSSATSTPRSIDVFPALRKRRT